MPAGEPGEMLIRGDGHEQGYYKDPAGTAAAFDAEGWLHTGDLAYRDERRYFFVVGRSKELIIKGGMNIAPKQIDEVLESHPAGSGSGRRGRARIAMSAKTSSRSSFSGTRCAATTWSY